jgi:hypothetical protein
MEVESLRRDYNGLRKGNLSLKTRNLDQRKEIMLLDAAAQDRDRLSKEQLIELEEVRATLLESQQAQRFLTHMKETLEEREGKSSREIERLTREAVVAANGQSAALKDIRAERDKALKIKKMEEDFEGERTELQGKILLLRGDNESSVCLLRKRLEQVEEYGRGYEQALGELREQGTALNEALRAKDKEIERLTTFETAWLLKAETPEFLDEDGREDAPVRVGEGIAGSPSEAAAVEEMTGMDWGTLAEPSADKTLAGLKECRVEGLLEGQRDPFRVNAQDNPVDPPSDGNESVSEDGSEPQPTKKKKTAKASDLRLKAVGRWTVPTAEETEASRAEAAVAKPAKDKAAREKTNAARREKTKIRKEEEARATSGGSAAPGAPTMREFATETTAGGLGAVRVIRNSTPPEPAATRSSSSLSHSSSSSSSSSSKKK